MAHEHVVAAPNETYQTFSETSLRLPDRLELPIGRIRPVQEAVEAMIKVFKRTTVPQIPDAKLSRMYRDLMQDAVPCKFSTLVFYIPHPGPLHRNQLGSYSRYEQFRYNFTDTGMIMIQAATGWFFKRFPTQDTWNLEFTILMVFERNNCVLYFFLLDQPAIIENCRYRFVYGTE
jgi:hypothetical protein